MKMVKRFFAPTKYDKAPCGTIWGVINEENKIHYYIQIEENDDGTDWHRYGLFLEEVFQDFLLDEDFIADCLALYYAKREELEEMN